MKKFIILKSVTHSAELTHAEVMTTIAIVGLAEAQKVLETYYKSAIEFETPYNVDKSASSISYSSAEGHRINFKLVAV